MTGPLRTDLQDIHCVHGKPSPGPCPECAVSHAAAVASTKIATGCEWTPDADGNWNTGCGQMFSIIDGTPIENDMKYCCYCGLCLDQLPYEDGDGDDEEERDEDWVDDPDMGAR